MGKIAMITQRAAIDRIQTERTSLHHIKPPHVALTWQLLQQWLHFPIKLNTWDEQIVANRLIYEADVIFFKTQFRPTHGNIYVYRQ